MRGRHVRPVREAGAPHLPARRNAAVLRRGVQGPVVHDGAAPAQGRGARRPGVHRAGLLAVIPAEAKVTTRCCSRACRSAYENARRASERRAAVLAEGRTCQSRTCGKPIPVPAAGSGPRTYCSPQCKSAEQARVWRERAPGYNRQRTTGVTPAQWAEAWDRQGGRCGICRRQAEAMRQGQGRPARRPRPRDRPVPGHLVRRGLQHGAGELPRLPGAADRGGWVADPPLGWPGDRTARARLASVRAAGLGYRPGHLVVLLRRGNLRTARHRRGRRAGVDHMARLGHLRDHRLGCPAAGRGRGSDKREMGGEPDADPNPARCPADRCGPGGGRGPVAARSPAGHPRSPRPGGERSRTRCPRSPACLRRRWPRRECPATRCSATSARGPAPKSCTPPSGDAARGAWTTYPNTCRPPVSSALTFVSPSPRPPPWTASTSRSSTACTGSASRKSCWSR